MSDQPNQERASDGAADAVASVMIIAIVVTAMYVWLSGMPS
ncbi:MAG: methionine synthase [Halioglobus sp.]|nr:methionine synthase [Halioglobus sp.]